MHMLKHNDRIGQLCRNGRTIYYAIFGQAMIESEDRDVIVAKLDQFADKLPEWDRNRR